MKKYLSYFMIPLVFFACSNKTSTSKSNTINKFLRCAQSEDTSCALSVLYKELQTRNTNRLLFDLRKIHKLLDNYKLPPENTWITKIDSTHPYSKIERITIPIYKGFDKNTHLEEAYIDFDFDYTGKYLSDETMMGYFVYTEYNYDK